MPTFREALAQAAKDTQVNLMADAVKNLEKRSTSIAQELNREYSEFFDYVSAEVIGTRGVGNGAPGDFGTPPNWIGSYTTWTNLSPHWVIQKARAIELRGAPESTEDYYHGISAYMAAPSRRRKFSSRRGRKGTFKKKRGKGSPFADFVEAKSKEVGLTQKLFGNLQLEFSVIRPDFGKVKLQRLGDAIKVIEQRAGRSGRFASAIDGTKLVVTIYAFNKIDPDWNENALVNYLIRRDGNKEQWGKINAKRPGNTWRIRPVLLPLINWYLQVGFKSALPSELKT